FSGWRRLDAVVSRTDTMSVTPFVKKSTTRGALPSALIRLSSPSDLAEVPNGARVKGKERVALYILWNGRGRRGMHLHHLFMLLEDDPNDVVDEIVGQFGVRDSEIVKAHRLIVAEQRGIGARGHARRRQLRHCQPQRCELLRGKRDVANLILEFELDERWKRYAGGDRQNVDRTRVNLGSQVGPVAIDEVCRDLQNVENVRKVRGRGAASGADADALVGHVGDGADVR